MLNLREWMKHKLQHRIWKLISKWKGENEHFSFAYCCTIVLYHRILNWFCGENISMHSSKCVSMTWGNLACRVFIFSIYVLSSKNKSDKIHEARNVLGTLTEGYIYSPFSRFDKITFYLLVKQRDSVNREVAGARFWRLYVSKRDKRANCLLDYFDSFSIRRNIAIDYKRNFRQCLAVAKNIFLGRLHLRRRKKWKEQKYRFSLAHSPSFIHKLDKRNGMNGCHWAFRGKVLSFLLK